MASESQSKVEVRRSEIEGAGDGLFAKVAFKKGDVVTRYDGNLISYREGRARRERNDGSDSHCVMVDRSHLICDAKPLSEYYKAVGHHNFMGDSRYHGGDSLGGFVNAGANSNVELCTSQDERLGADFWKKRNQLSTQTIVNLIAKRAIRAGEELLMDYAFSRTFSILIFILIIINFNSFFKLC